MSEHIPTLSFVDYTQPFRDRVVGGSLVELDLTEMADIAAKTRTADRLAAAYHEHQKTLEKPLGTYTEWVARTAAAVHELDAAYKDYREVWGA